MGHQQHTEVVEAAGYSDRRDRVALVADHLFSLSSADNLPDALDYFGPWKPHDGRQTADRL